MTSIFYLSGKSSLMFGAQSTSYSSHNLTSFCGVTTQNFCLQVTWHRFFFAEIALFWSAYCSSFFKYLLFHILKWYIVWCYFILSRIILLNWFWFFNFLRFYLLYLVYFIYFWFYFGFSWRSPIFCSSLAV